MSKFLQWTWELPQTLIGWIISRLIIHGSYGYNDRVIIRTEKRWGVSLGRYIIISVNHTGIVERHEYGHCWQSRYLGPFYLIMVGIPSISRIAWTFVLRRVFKWDGVKISKWYYSGWPEKQADKLGKVERWK